METMTQSIVCPNCEGQNIRSFSAAAVADTLWQMFGVIRYVAWIAITASG
jgi:cytochrome c-type biogenesis protein CcmH/NrfF